MKRLSFVIVVALSLVFWGILPVEAQDLKIVAVGICENLHETESDLCPVYEDMSVGLISVPGKVNNLRYLDPEWVVFDQEDTSVSTVLLQSRFNWGAQHPSHVYLAEVSKLSDVTSWQKIDDCEFTESCSLYSVVDDQVYYAKEDGVYEHAYEGNNYGIDYETTSFFAYSLAGGNATEIKEIPSHSQKNPRRFALFPECYGLCLPAWALSFHQSLDGKISVTNLYVLWQGQPHSGSVANGVALNCEFCTYPVWVPGGAIFATRSFRFVYVKVEDGLTTVTHQILDFKPRYFTSPYN